MPYIPEEDRIKLIENLCQLDLDTVLDGIINHVQNQTKKKGLCNYMVSRIVAGGMAPSEGWGYDTISNARSCLLDAGLELGRRLMDGYEDSCIERNGDVKEYANAKFKGQK